jgi:hypothetical protein
MATQNSQWNEYIELHWTTDQDICELDDCENVMGPDNYVSSWEGNYCSEECKEIANDHPPMPWYDEQEDFGADLGISVSDPYEPYDF